MAEMINVHWTKRIRFVVVNENLVSVLFDTVQKYPGFLPNLQVFGP